MFCNIGVVFHGRQCSRGRIPTDSISNVLWPVSCDIGRKELTTGINVVQSPFLTHGSPGLTCLSVSSLPTSASLPFFEKVLYKSIPFVYKVSMRSIGTNKINQPRQEVYLPDTSQPLVRGVFIGRQEAGRNG